MGSENPTVPLGSRGSPGHAGHRAHWLPGLLIVLAAVMAYHNSFSVPFLFDDDSSIRHNPSLQNFWSAWSPPAGQGQTVSGRPLLNLTFALNYILGGRDVRGYHWINLAIHAGAGLALFGVVWRTLRQPLLAPRFGADARALAGVIALLWVVHPLQTESVTYIVQRAESLVGLLYLCTLLGFIRSVAPGAHWRWPVLTVLCCALGMAAKEVMVTAPVVLLCYDRIFAAGSWRGVWRQRACLHLALVATWLLLAGLLAGTGNRGGTAGFGTASSFDYACTQAWAVAHYLRLAVWPAPLVFDYGEGFVTDARRVLPGLALLVPLVVLGFRAAWQGRAVGFCAIFFFCVLAPSSSVVPVVTQTAAEHRMYLPLAAPLALLVLAAHQWRWRVAGPVLLAGVVVLGTLTIRRNETYRSSQALWADTVAKWPEGARAQANLGGLLALWPHRQAEAIRHLEQSLALRPDEPGTLINLGLALGELPGRRAEAVAALGRALALDPRSALAHANLAAVLRPMPGREAEALSHAERALQLDPTLAEAHASVGAILADDPARGPEAIRHLREAVRLEPGLAESQANLGVALAADPRDWPEALARVDEAVRLRPDSAGIRQHLGVVLGRLGRTEAAAGAYAEALRLDPENWQAHYNLGMLRLEEPARAAEAVTHLEQAARLAPGDFNVRTNLGFALGEMPGRLAEACREFSAAVLLRPESPDAHFNHGAALWQLTGHDAAAAAEFETVLRLKPDDVQAHQNLAAILAADPARIAEARRHLVAVLRLAPDDQPARELLARLAETP